MAEQLHKDHRKRLRERAAESGIHTLRDHELLELVMGYAIPRKDTNELAHLLLNRFGTFRDLFRADAKALQEIEYMGENSAWFIRLLSELFRRYALEFFVGPQKLDHYPDRIYYFLPHFMGRVEECVYAAFLNDQYEVIRAELQYTGSAQAVEVHADRMLKTLKELPNCRKVVLAHNHFQTTVPSLHDRLATKSIYQILKKNQVELVDHVIICGDRGSSMEHSGHLQNIREELGEG